MNLVHRYAVDIEWTGDRGTGTSGYRDYSRAHTVTAAGKRPIEGSADRAFHGDADRWNPEEMLLAALSQCHMLSYLHVAVLRGVVVTAYTSTAEGVLRQDSDGGGAFDSAVLRPLVTVASADMVEAAEAAHAEAARKCFIAASVAFPVSHEARTVVAS